MDETISQLGESELLKRLAPFLAEPTEELPLGSGDDVAITPAFPNRRIAWTIDTMIEDIHFRWWDHPLANAENLGWKLGAVNLSDLASKGANPNYALLSLGVPSSTPWAHIEAFYTGLTSILEEFDCLLIGGDTVRSPKWNLSLTLAGILPPGYTIASRDKAAPGQFLYVTGYPGEAGAGIDILEKKIDLADPLHKERLVRRALVPTPRLKVGSKLASQIQDLAMMDVSDGVVNDAERLASRSQVSIILESTNFPKSQALEAVTDWTEYFLYGGDDYELLFSTKEHVEGSSIHRIGRVEEGSGVWLETELGERRPLSSGGFQHFAESENDG